MKDMTLFHKNEWDGMHFQSRRRSRKGIAGFILAMLGTLIFLALCIISAVAKGEAGSIVGIIGLGVMVICGIAFYLSLKGLKEQDVYTRLPFAGLVVSGGLFVLLFCLYVLGIRF